MFFLGEKPESLQQLPIENIFAMLKKMTASKIISLFQDLPHIPSLDQERGRLGLVYKDGKNGTDHKRYFHYNPHIYPFLADKYKNVDDLVDLLEYEGYDLFLQLCERVYAIVIEKMIEQAQQRGYDMEKMHTTEMKTSNRVRLHSLLRVIQYEKKKEGENFTQPHQDRFAMTCIIDMSSGGLKIGNTVGNLEEVEIEKNKFLLFPGLGLQETMKIPALWHEVIAKLEQERFALVMFLNIPNTQS